MNGHLGSRAAAYVDGALPAAETSRAREHVASCERCRAQVEEQIRVRDLLRGSGRATRDTAPVHPQDGFLAGLATMSSSGVPQRASAPRTVRSRRELAQRCVFSGLVAGLALVSVAWSVGGETSEAQAVAIAPDRLGAQHAVTAGDLPFWGSPGMADAAASPAMGSSPLSAMERLRVGAGALQSVSYRGVQQSLTDDDGTEQSAVTEISHIVGHGTATRVASGGEVAALFRPQSATEAAQGRDALALLSSRYVVVPDGSGTVAGRTTDRVVAYAASGLVAARFWIDRASGLPLASERYGSNGDLETGTRFTSVAVDDAAAMPKHLPIASTATWVESPGGTAPAALEADGWLCPGAVVAGDLEAFDATLAEGMSAPVLHLVYTDGLRAVSVFEQRARLDPQQLQGFAATTQSGRQVFLRAGAPGQATWAEGPFVITVVGDEASISAVVGSLASANPVTAEEAGRLDRVSRVAHGLARVGSWFDPIG